MSENQFKNNIILNSNTNRTYSISPSITSTDFYFVMPITIDHTKSDIVSKIQLVSHNDDSFKSTFTSMFFDQPSNYKKYRNNESIDLINNKLINNIYLDYNKKQSTEGASFFEEVSFDKKNFVVEQDNQTNVYNIIFPVSFSKRLVNNSISNLRILFVDSKNSIIDQSDISQISFTRIKNDNTRIDTELFYRTYFLNDFANSAQINLSSLGAIIQSSNNINTNVFERINISLKYNNIEESNRYHTNNINTYILNIDSVTKQVASDLFIDDIPTARIEAVFELSTPDQSIIRLQKSFLYDSTSSFARTCLRLNKSRLASEKLNHIGFNQEISIENNKIAINFNTERSTNFLDKIYIIDIRKNNSSIENLYSGVDLTLENKFDYRGKSLSTLFSESETNNLFYTQSGGSRECIIEVTLSFLDTIRAFASNKIVATSDYSTSIENVNKLFKRNLNVSKVELNRLINDQNNSILSYSDISLNNFDNFSDIAYSLGYIENDQSDVKSFLENCLIKIEAQTRLNRLSLVTNRTSYFFFKEVFDTSTYNSGMISIRQDYIDNYVLTDDYFELNCLKIDKLNQNIFKFFTSHDEENAFKFLVKENDVVVDSSLTIKILPLPKILIEYRGKGLDTLGNPIDNILHSEIADIDIIRKRLSRELVMFFYTGNTNFNWDRFNVLKEIFFDEEKTRNVLNYTSFFDNLIDINVKNGNIFNIKTSLNREDLLLAINTNDSYINSNIFVNTAEENLMTKYFNFSLNNNEIFCDTLPYYILYKDISYSQINNEYNIKDITILSGDASEIIIDITFLKSFYNINDLLSINPLVKISTHFMLSAADSNIDLENTSFMLTNFNSKSCITYNENYIRERQGSFSNFTNNIDRSLISVSEVGQKLLMSISIDNNYIDINNISYAKYFNFFEYAKNNFLDYIESILMRFSISFEIPEANEYIAAVFSKDIPTVNLNNKKINISKLNRISYTNN